MSTLSTNAFDKSKKVSKKKIPKIRYSNWFITVVANQKDSPKVRKKLVGIVTRIYDHNRIKPYIDGDVETILPLEKKGIVIEGSFEVAKKTRYPHAHMTIKIKHRGKILLSYEHMRAALNEAMGFGDGRDNRFILNQFHSKIPPPRLRVTRPSMEGWRY